MQELPLSATPVTLLILAATVIVSWRTMDDYRAKSKLLMNPYQVVHGKDYARILTHGLIHGSWIHLIFNMIVFYSFGQLVELVFTSGWMGEQMFGKVGHLVYLLLYVGAIAFATLPSLIKHRDNPGYNSLGASGAVFAVLTVAVLINPTGNVLFFFAIPCPGWLALIIMFGTEYYLQKRGGTGIAHDAHLWGAGFGILFVAIFKMEILLGFFKQIQGALSF